jgi:hypothetical protein
VFGFKGLIRVKPLSVLHPLLKAYAVETPTTAKINNSHFLPSLATCFILKTQKPWSEAAD